MSLDFTSPTARSTSETTGVMSSGERPAIQIIVSVSDLVFISSFFYTLPFKPQNISKCSLQLIRSHKTFSCKTTPTQGGHLPRVTSAPLMTTSPQDTIDDWQSMFIRDVFPGTKRQIASALSHVLATVNMKNLI